MKSPAKLTLVTTASSLALALGLAACGDKGGAGKTETKPAASKPAPAASSAAASAAPTAPPTQAAPAIDPKRLELFAPLPEVVENPENPLTPEKIDLGRQLYFDKRLSAGGDVSCNSCHGLNTYGVDGKPFSEGHKKQLGGRNSPSVYHAAGHVAQFWDGRAKDVEEQAMGPVTNPVEMAMKDGKAVEKVLKGIPGYVEAFKKAFPDAKEPVTFENMGRAIAAFERKLMTPSKWDKFLKGDKAALNADEINGFNTFVETGCVTCHSGAYVGGSMYNKLGLVKPWPAPADPKVKPDEGRFAVTKNEADKGFFKVPSLRNIAKTGPYFHDGSVASLDEAVKMMASHQLGRDLTPEQSKSILAFLDTLTGELPGEYIAEPTLPDSPAK
ncbi:cytochrome-c peroxidase [Myxococcota bacterium]|jgi:cytochrome c peroxidase|nr:cytochrome-c peroxidase [Myxococcota bacterium]